ncbi:hypothetical protein VHARVF571_600171 [Vibrio harveyi]|nr:hypothetical protein VHARVF571_600171 [Vibrio harveyi]
MVCLAFSNDSASTSSVSSFCVRRVAFISCTCLKRKTAQVKMDAASSESITPFTTQSAAWYIPIGDKSWVMIGLEGGAICVSVTELFIEVPVDSVAEEERGRSARLKDADTRRKKRLFIIHCSL